jgi:hypothetical protein
MALLLSVSDKRFEASFNPNDALDSQYSMFRATLCSAANSLRPAHPPFAVAGIAVAYRNGHVLRSAGARGCTRQIMPQAVNGDARTPMN